MNSFRPIITIKSSLFGSNTHVNSDGALVIKTNDISSKDNALFMTIIITRMMKFFAQTHATYRYVGPLNTPISQYIAGLGPYGRYLEHIMHGPNTALLDVFIACNHKVLAENPVRPTFIDDDADWDIIRSIWWPNATKRTEDLHVLESVGTIIVPHDMNGDRRHNWYVFMKKYYPDVKLNHPLRRMDRILGGVYYSDELQLNHAVCANKFSPNMAENTSPRIIRAQVFVMTTSLVQMLKRFNVTWEYKDNILLLTTTSRHLIAHFS